MPRLAIIHFLDGGDGPVDPGFGMPGYGGGRPDNSLPGSGGRPDNSLPGTGPNYPGHALPGGGHIATLPVFPFDPTRPSNELPGEQPEAGNDLPRPGKKYVVKWLACTGLILVPDNELPPTATPK